MNIALQECAQALVAPGKGILAADESLPTIAKRFQSIGVTSTEALRRAYRTLLFTSPDLEVGVAGVIMFHETLGQCDEQGQPLPALLAARGVMPGIKVDLGVVPLAGSPEEKITQGLDGLRERLAEYREQGARFAKWRAVIAIGDDFPSEHCVEANAQALARYAALCQEQQLVPIVEPEVLMTGRHSIERCEQVTGKVWQGVFAALYTHGVSPESMLLKPNMVTAGADCPNQASVEEVARRTVGLLRRFVPAAVPGIVFLSGGQSAVTATAHLNAINCQGSQPWRLSFSFGRALQDPTLKIWAGQEQMRSRAQAALTHRVRCNSAATLGRYDVAMESAAES